MERLKMTYKIEDIKNDSRWINKINSKEIEIRYVYYSLNCLQYFYTNNPNRYYESSLEGLLEHFKPKPVASKQESTLQMEESGKTVGKLLNGDEVIVIIKDGAYKGGHTTKVKYELADFMDDEPPFMEILFVDKYDDTVYFTADMIEPVYELNGLLVVVGKGDNNV